MDGSEDGRERSPTGVLGARRALLSLSAVSPRPLLSLSLSSIFSYLARTAAHPAGRPHDGRVLVAVAAIQGAAGGEGAAADGFGLGLFFCQAGLARQARKHARHPLHGVEEEGDAEQVAEDDGGDPNLERERGGDVSADGRGKRPRRSARVLARRAMRAAPASFRGLLPPQSMLQPVKPRA